MDSNIFEILYAKYYNIAYIYTLSLCKSKESAEDIALLAFEKAFISIDSDKGEFKYWLLTVCRNLWIDSYRKHNRFAHVNLEEDRFIQDKENILERLITKEKNRKVFECIMRLPSNYNEILVLHYYADIPIINIAKLLNITYSNAKTLIFRARAKLKIVLEESDYEF